METNKVKIRVAGSEISIITDEDPKYVNELGKQVDNDLADIFNSSPKISTTQAAVLLCMSYLDENRKSGNSTSQLRAQIKDYLDDASSAKTKADFARREAEKAKKIAEVAQAENDRLTAENGRLKAQLAEILKKIENS